MRKVVSRELTVGEEFMTKVKKFEDIIAWQRATL